jgi:hypothetical protein
MISNVKDFVDLEVNYGAEHLGKSMAPSTLDMVRQALKRRYTTQLSMASWRWYTNLILDRNKYAGDGIEGLNRDQIRLRILERADQYEFETLFLAHETNMPKGNIFIGR